VRPNRENQRKMWRSEHRILVALRSVGPTRFTLAHREARCSERTLAKHLKSMMGRGLVEKIGASYRLTDLGLEHIDRLESQLGQLTKSGSTPSALDVDTEERNVTSMLTEPVTSPADRADESMGQSARSIKSRQLEAVPCDRAEDIALNLREKKESIGGPICRDDTDDRFFLHVPPSMVQKGGFPFRPGTPLVLEMKGNCLVIREDDQEKIRIPFLAPNSSTCWFKGTCKITQQG